MNILPKIKSTSWLILALFLAKIKKKGFLGLSVDTSYRCNLHCQHCYFRWKNYQEELEEEKYLNLLKNFRKMGVIFAAWVGGEPLLRKSLVEKGKKLFPLNWIVTNGTILLPDWPDVNFFISIDGPAEIHNQIRGKNVYQIIKENIKRSKNNIYTASVIHRLNYQYIEEMVEEWKETNVKGMSFDFYTPALGDKNDNLWLNWQERDQIIERLERLYTKYRGFIFLTPRILQLLKSDQAPAVLNNCLIKERIISLDPLGKRKFPCVIEGGDCLRCGCIITYISHAVFKDYNLKSVWLLNKTF